MIITLKIITQYQVILNFSKKNIANHLIDENKKTKRLSFQNNKL